MKQYMEIKDKYPDSILLFRVGDFYETFHEDAVITSKVLGIILTKRGSGANKETKLAGFPYHSLDTYLHKLVKAGHRVAICEQLENPKLTKKIVKRGVTDVITPGVSLNDEILDKKENNFLAAIKLNKNIVGVAFLDISTGEFLVGEGSFDYSLNLLQTFSPKEILILKKDVSAFSDKGINKEYFFYVEEWMSNINTSLEKIKNHFNIKSLKGFGIDNNCLGIIPASIILHYLENSHKKNLSHITKLKPIISDAHVWMDRFTISNLEILRSKFQGGKSLLDTIDRTTTSMGSRMMRMWLSFPSIDLNEIKNRQEIVSDLISNSDINLDSLLKNIIDLERIVSKLANGRVTPRELVNLKESLISCIEIKNIIKERSKKLKSISKEINVDKKLIELISNTLIDESPVNILKGNAIKKGVNKELDSFRNILQNNKKNLQDILQREIENTGISSLKISFNNVFGYYIEVRNTHKDKVPTEWIRKQTLVNAERYVTDELKKFETEIFQAEEQISILEQQLFEEFINFLKNNLELLKENATAIANLDVFYCFADIAIRNNYSCPSLKSDNFIDIKGARHPVIEKHLPVDSPYISNDLRLNSEDQQILMITGPNMSGKSALLRQTALISLLAQIGSFVPATKATLGLVDKIFTRVGASDNISMGASTFMVEMNETASILNNISRKSLVILDEIGRGTSTYDGVSIAWAIAQYLHEHPFKPRVLFATHYHELNEMNLTFKRIKNFNVSIKETKEDVLFLRKLLPGGSAHSFGIHVAKMAGIPQNVLKTAKKKLKILESTHGLEKKHLNKKGDPDLQLSFFNLDDPILEAIKEEIEDLDIDNLTPVEALMQLNNIKRKLSQKKD